MAEELALQQVFRQGHAVHDDERHLASLAPAVDGVSEDLLAGAALAEKQHGGHRCGRLPGDLYGLPDGRAVAQNLRGAGVQRIPKQSVGLNEPPVLQGFSDDNLEMMRIERLGKEIVRTFPHGLDSRFDGAVGCDDDDGEVHRVSAQRPQDLYSPHPGHLKIKEHECRRLLPQSGQGLLSIGRHDRVATQGPQAHIQEPSRGGIVIRDQDSRPGSVHGRPFAPSISRRQRSEGQDCRLHPVEESSSVV